jgi:hypothetical protein
MASRRSRISATRSAVGLVAVVAALFGAGSAQAAMGGALPLTSTFRPDLRTVTLVASNAAQFCFDKVLNGAAVGPAKDFGLGGYEAPGLGYYDFTSIDAATTAVSAVLDDTNPMCVDVVFPTAADPTTAPTVTGGTADLTQYTFGSVAAGAVLTNTHAEPNDADSTALTGSTTNNGTTGNTVEPDLTGVVVNTSFNTVNYVFNKNIGGVELAAGKGFFLINSAGQVCREDTAANVTYSANVVTVVYPTVPTADCPVTFTAFPKPVNAAVRAGLDAFVVESATVRGFANEDTQSVIVPGTSGTTGLADLLSAVVSSDGNTIAYTFDKPIGTAPVPSDFEVVLGDGDVSTGTGTPTISNTATTGTVTVTMGSIGQGSTYNEFDVKASVLPGAATVLNEPASGNTYGSVPVGDNAGAFARGFTTGPDATGVTFNSTTGQAVVSFDQRVNLTTVPPKQVGFVLLDQDGTPVASAAATGATGVPSAAGPVQITVSFPPAAFAVAKALEICGPPDNVGVFAAPAECGGTVIGGTVVSSGISWPNVQQIVTPFATSAVLRPGAKAHWKHATRVSRRAFARQVRAAERRAHLRHIG